MVSMPEHKPHPNSTSFVGAHNLEELEVLALNLDSHIEQQLEMLGAKTEAGKTELARKALAEALEDMLDLRLAEARQAKQERSWTLEEIERGDDLEG